MIKTGGLVVISPGRYQFIEYQEAGKWNKWGPVDMFLRLNEEQRGIALHPPIVENNPLASEKLLRKYIHDMFDKNPRIVYLEYQDSHLLIIVPEAACRNTMT